MSFRRHLDAPAFTPEDALHFMGSVRVPHSLEKRAADLTTVMPGLLGLGAAGSAGFFGMREARAVGKIRAYRDIKDRDAQNAAVEDIERESVRKALPMGAAAAMGTGYLLGAHVPEDLIRETTASGTLKGRRHIKDLNTARKILYAPGAMTQRGLARLGATSNVGKAIANAGMLGTGLLVGTAVGKRVANRYIDDRMRKEAGLFMKPSDVAGNHMNLSAALEEKLNGIEGQGTFKKHAGDKREYKRGISAGGSAALGAVGGAVLETVRRETSDPVSPPPEDEPKGVRARIGRAVHRARYEHDSFSRRNPGAATVLAAGTGAAAGAMTGLGRGASELNKTVKAKP
ncbi:MAG: hypothetical protein ACO32I_02770 [Candidatus Limnocylindrus sp.]